MWLAIHAHCADFEGAPIVAFDLPGDGEIEEKENGSAKINVEWPAEYWIRAARSATQVATAYPFASELKSEVERECGAVKKSLVALLTQ